MELSDKEKSELVRKVELTNNNRVDSIKNLTYATSKMYLSYLVGNVNLKSCLNKEKIPEYLSN